MEMMFNATVENIQKRWTGRTPIAHFQNPTVVCLWNNLFSTFTTDCDFYNLDPTSLQIK